MPRVLATARIHSVILPLSHSCTSIETEWFHVPLSIGYSYLYLSIGGEVYEGG